MKEFKLPITNLPAEINLLLFVAWVQYFSDKQLSLTQHGSGSTSDGGRMFTFGDPLAANFKIEQVANGAWKVASASDVDSKVVESICGKALKKVEDGDMGGDVVYTATLESKGFAIDAVNMANFARQLGDQVTIAGRFRLSDVVIVEFVPKQDDGQQIAQLFAPATEIKVALFVPGPIACDLTQKVAAGMLEVVGAICAFALGKVVDIQLIIFPAAEADAKKWRNLRYDKTIHTLTRDGISLDVFGDFGLLGGADGIMRLRGALLSFHAALQQQSQDVQNMLMVSAIEALIVPRPEWRTGKATKRFLVTIEELCPDVVDSLVEHPNVEQAFEYTKKGGPKAKRKQLLNQIYSLRSIPTHSGVGLSGIGMLSALSDSSNMRVALLSDLARGSMLKFLQAPRSSLIGHPILDTSDEE